MNEKRDNRIPDAIDKIEPADGAKERMLANIRQKAAEQTAAEKSENRPIRAKILPFRRAMKWALPVAACFVIAVIGAIALPKIMTAPGEDVPGTIVEGGSPFVSVSDATEFENALGITIDAPKDAEDAAYSIIDGEIADMFFSWNGHDYDLRASKQSGDFSGLNGIEVEAVQIDAERNATLSTIRMEDGIYKKITWTDGKITFILTNADGAEDDEISAVFEAIK